MNNYSELFRQQLNKHNLKYTTQRRAILDALVQYEGQKFSVEEMYEVVKGRYPEIGLATIYRTMLLLQKFGLVTKVSSETACSRYSLIENKTDKIEQCLLCTKCGKIADIRKTVIAKFEREVQKQCGFETKNCKVKFYGYCKRCIKKNI